MVSLSKPLTKSKNPLLACISLPITFPFLSFAITPSCNCCSTPENLFIPLPWVILRSSFTPPSALIAASRTILSLLRRLSSAVSLPALSFFVPSPAPGGTTSVVVGVP